MRFRLITARERLLRGVELSARADGIDTTRIGNMRWSLKQSWTRENVRAVPSVSPESGGVRQTIAATHLVFGTFSTP